MDKTTTGSEQPKLFLKKTIPDWILGEKIEYFDPRRNLRHWKGFGQRACIVEAPEKDPYVAHRYVRIEFLLDDDTPSGHTEEVNDDYIIRLSDPESLSSNVKVIANVLTIVNPRLKHWRFTSTKQFEELEENDIVKFTHTNPETPTANGLPPDWTPQAGYLYEVTQQNRENGWLSIVPVDDPELVECIIIWDPKEERHWYE